MKFDDEQPEPRPFGKYEETDDGCVVTLPNGNKYITKTVMNADGPLAVLLVFPNGQVFSSNTAKGDFNPTFVNQDETVVARLCHPATKTGDLHIYIKGENGKYRELPNEENGAVREVLGKAYDDFDGTILDIRGITERTVTLWAITRRSDGYYKFEFKLNVTPDGQLVLENEKENSSPTESRAVADAEANEKERIRQLEEENSRLRAAAAQSAVTKSAASPTRSDADDTDGPPMDVVETALRNSISQDPSWLPRGLELSRGYAAGYVKNIVTQAELTNQYTRSVEGEVMYIYDFKVDVDVAVTVLQDVRKGAAGGIGARTLASPKHQTSLGIVRRGKKWYTHAVPR